MLLWIALAHAAPTLELEAVRVQLSPARPEVQIYFPLPHRLPPPAEASEEEEVDALRSRYRDLGDRRAAFLRARAELLDAVDRGEDWKPALASLPIEDDALDALCAAGDVQALSKRLREQGASLASEEAAALDALLRLPPPDGAAVEWAWYTFEQQAWRHYDQLDAYDAVLDAWAEAGAEGAAPEPPRLDTADIDALLARAAPDDRSAALLRLHANHLAERPDAPADLELLLGSPDPAVADAARLRLAAQREQAGAFGEAAALYAAVEQPDARHLEAEALRQAREWDAAAAALASLLAADVSTYLREDAALSLARISLAAADARGEDMAARLVAAGTAEEPAAWEAALALALREAPDQLPPLIAHAEARWPTMPALAPARAREAPAVVLQQIGQVAACIERIPWPTHEPPVERLDIALTIRRSEVRSVSVEGTDDPDLLACVERRASAWHLDGRADLSVPVIVSRW